ncbi:MAG: hypothetical protein ACR2H5_00275 [Ktedonobacteraceae bacterium]
MTWLRWWLEMVKGGWSQVRVVCQMQIGFRAWCMWLTSAHAPHPSLAMGWVRGHLASLANDGGCLCVVGGTRSGGGMPLGPPLAANNQPTFFAATQKSRGAEQSNTRPYKYKKG